MKRFKEWDIALQTLFLILYAIALFVDDWLIRIVAAFACIGWLLVSLFVHHVRHWFTRKHLYRTKFANIILLLVLATLSGFIAQTTSLVILFIALTLAACGYLFICISEMHLLLKRPLSYLK
ncbi:hypothetical protein QTN47_21755 [Danxiaibacter flavus]|uniref:Uncharacterized protein n=1 Tax=Danxiaibacter flavus TaxID=3049108 RepID=A0ABV3ZL00_9BACT|nr:hypothetical protein QNM32_21760 [Chitinophagaceae bacterium DXS]